MTSVRTTNGQTLILGQMLGKGGEGTVYHVDGKTDLAVKIYTDGKTAEHRDKIVAMVAGGYHRSSSLVAFPIDVVLDLNGEFTGFTMRKVIGVKPIHELYSPGSRKSEFPNANFRFLTRTALNVSRAIASVHQTGCVIGDINHSGILVSDQATVTLIDSDSFQIRSGSQVYRCRVGVGEYTPPELQGQVLAKVDRTQNHDAFGLAVLLFQLLFMGRHPFAGRFSGSGDMSIEKAIVEGRFAYSSRKTETKMDPPPFVPTLADMPHNINAAFEKAFRPIRTLADQRPVAADWVEMLGLLEKELLECRINPTHHYYRNASTCPWCRLEGGMGITLFNSPQIRVNNSFDIESALRAISNIIGPGPSPDLEGILEPVAGLTVSPIAMKAKIAKRKRLLGAIVIAFFGIILTVFGGGIGIIGLIVTVVMLFVKGKWEKEVYTALKRAVDDWKQIRADWLAETGPARFDQKFNALQSLANEYRTLSILEKNKLDELQKQKRALQLHKYLEAHTLMRAKIPNIGTGRKTTLASYGIESALDIAKNRILSVPGFGESLTADLLNWRNAVEARFVFNPSLSTDLADIRRVKDVIARRRTEIEQSLTRGAVELKQITDHTQSLRAKPIQRVIDAHKQLREAEFNVDAIGALQALRSLF